MVVAVTFLAPFFCACVWGTWRVVRPTYTEADLRNLSRFRFLLFRFRPDCWWWGNLFSVRQILLVFAGVLPKEQPHGQIIWMNTVLIIYTVMQAHVWPWKTHDFNVLDAATNSLLVTICTTSTVFLNVTADTSAGYAYVLLGLMLSLYGGIAAFVLLCFYYVIRHRSLTATFGGNSTKGHTHARIGSEWLKMCKLCVDLDEQGCLEAIRAMNEFDRKALVRSIAVMQATGHRGFQGQLAVTRLIGAGHTTANFSRHSLQEIQREIEQRKGQAKEGVPKRGIVEWV